MDSSAFHALDASPLPRQGARRDGPAHPGKDQGESPQDSSLQGISGVERGPSQVWGSGGNGRLRVCIVSGSESLSEAGAERPIVDGAANLEQKISPSPRPTHLL